jgi:hypothetical protein
MSDPLKVYPNRAKWMIAALACGIMTTAGVWIIGDGQWLGLVPTVFFGLGFVVSLILLLPNSSFLELDDNGFLFRNLFRESRFSWADIAGFEAHRLSMRKFVTFNFAQSYTASRRARALARTVSGAEGALPDTYGMFAEDLADLMNERLRIYKQTPANGNAT